MKNTENAAKPMSAIVYRHVCPWRLSTRPAQTSFRSDRSSSSAFMPSWNHIDPQDGSPNRAPESNSRTQDPRSDLRLRFSRIENRWVFEGSIGTPGVGSHTATVREIYRRLGFITQRWQMRIRMDESRTLRIL